MFCTLEIEIEKEKKKRQKKRKETETHQNKVCNSYAFHTTGVRANGHNIRARP